MVGNDWTSIIQYRVHHVSNGFSTEQRAKSRLGIIQPICWLQDELNIGTARMTRRHSLGRLEALDVLMDAIEKSGHKDKVHKKWWSEWIH